MVYPQLPCSMSHIPTGRNCKVDTPNQGEVDVTDVGDVRKCGFEVHDGLEVVHSSKDETVK